MALLRAQINNLALDYLSSVVGQEVITRDETFNYLPFVDISPSAVHAYNRELTIGTNTSASVVLPTGTWSESAPTYTHVQDSIKIFGDSAYVPKMSLNNAQVVGSVIAAKSKMVNRSWSKYLINGTGTDPFATGFFYMVSGSSTQETAATTGVTGSLTLAKMDEAYDLVTAGKPSFYVMNSTIARSFKSLIRSTGTTAEYLQYKDYGSPMLSYNGIPILINDWATTDVVLGATGTNRVYCVYANEADGVTGFYNGNTLFDVSNPIEVNQSDMVEFKVVMRAGLSMKSSKAISCIYGVTG